MLDFNPQLELELRFKRRLSERRRQLPSGFVLRGPHIPLRAGRAGHNTVGFNFALHTVSPYVLATTP